MKEAIIRESVVLAPMTTFYIGGPARYFAEVGDVNQLPALFSFADTHGLPVFILGAGSNILVGDNGFDGLVIRLMIKDFIRDGDEEEHQFFIAGAGMSWDEFVAETVARDCGGAENLSLIPGTVGGAIVQNIGAYGSEVSDIVDWVEAYDAKAKKVRRLSRSECAFGYRESIFKKEDELMVVLRVRFRLHAHSTPNIAYKDLTAYFADAHTTHPTIADVRRAVVAVRTGKFPIARDHGTAGSFFKNPTVSADLATPFLARFPNAVHTKFADGTVKFSAAWIIDNVLHMRGVRVGRVGCAETQALVVVNYGGATSAEVKNFVSDIQKKFFHETNFTIEREVIFVGE